MVQEPPPPYKSWVKLLYKVEEKIKSKTLNVSETDSILITTRLGEGSISLQQIKARAFDEIMKGLTASIDEFHCRFKGPDELWARTMLLGKIEEIIYYHGKKNNG